MNAQPDPKGASPASLAARSDAVAGSPAAIGYGRQSIDPVDIDAVVAVLSGDWLTQGPAVAAFESALSEATGAPHAVAVANGTQALRLAARALDIGPGDTVVTTANTFLATATSALSVGARVEFLDVEERSANLDLDRLEERLEAGPTPRAVTVVHFAGLPLDMERVLSLKARFGFLLIEDAAHALGASYRAQGRTWRVGEHPYVDATCLSFHPVKHVTTGEGGAILVHDRERAERLCSLRSHGVRPDAGEMPFHDESNGGSPPPWFGPMMELGDNARLSDIAAALGVSQMTRLPAFLARRRELAARYRERFLGRSDVQTLDPGGLERRHAWHLFCVRVDPVRRDEVMVRLRERGVGTQLHYYPVPYQPWFQKRIGKTRFPNAELHARSSLSLPLFPGLRDDELERVADTLIEVLER